jgi:hypothetical protein
LKTSRTIIERSRGKDDEPINTVECGDGDGAGDEDNDEPINTVECGDGDGDEDNVSSREPLLCSKIFSVIQVVNFA